MINNQFVRGIKMSTAQQIYCFSDGTEPVAVIANTYREAYELVTFRRYRTKLLI